MRLKLKKTEDSPKSKPGRRIIINLWLDRHGRRHRLVSPGMVQRWDYDMQAWLTLEEDDILHDFLYALVEARLVDNKRLK